MFQTKKIVSFVPPLNISAHQIRSSTTTGLPTNCYAAKDPTGPINTVLSNEPTKLSSPSESRLCSHSLHLVCARRQARSARVLFIVIYVGCEGGEVAGCRVFALRLFNGIWSVVTVVLVGGVAG